jgi:hypothetical protein
LPSDVLDLELVSYLTFSQLPLLDEDEANVDFGQTADAGEQTDKRALMSYSPKIGQ